MTDDDLRRLAALVVDEMFARMSSRPANDVRPKVRRRYQVAADVERDDVAAELARQALRSRGVRVR